MRVHFIAIGGSAMHNLAIAMKQNGAIVTGSDDEVFEPSSLRLLANGLLPEVMGWFPERITSDIDAVILGMHARKDNPELQRAQETGIKVYSYPEYLYEQCRNKKRVVIGGSHGKTTVTSMIMHALRVCKIEFDYMVGAQLEGFDTMVQLSETATIAIFEGDEYLSSPVDMRPKFLWYKPHIALVTGVAWDHINVFPTIEIYNKQFELFIDSIEPGGYLAWFEEDPVLAAIINDKDRNHTCQAYGTLQGEIRDDLFVVKHDGKEYPVPVFGSHNLQNMAGAMQICMQLGLTQDDFMNAMKSFKGASRRLQVLVETLTGIVFYDFAHAPSKLKASVKAVKERYPDRALTACIELHTFSSLSNQFLEQYYDSMSYADRAIVYFNPDVVKHKNLPEIVASQVAKAFNLPDTSIITNREKLQLVLESEDLNNKNILIMTSGNLAGINLQNLAQLLKNRSV
jgi:UDP-N-acetylmuramate: L-alanyl-gamma-D-glutamyl-meso-diaminopimelate ligase